ncbi:diguanylate cyclase [Massilia forsythiae]|uniref:Diguanylate cyclase n=1 Tax=Massilia forsythiae TaxID=2728020 RepID=A0A7Z2VZB2_9BURK|nr:GGDEF domain-containing protein [Massilia forsythiae]QJE01657.1 diguanylate cyclase [Massilia forsythiae]
MSFRIPFFPKSSLRLRLSAAASALALAVAALAGTLAVELVERDLRGVLGDQQMAMLSGAAAFMDERLDARLRQIEMLGASVPADVRADPTRLQAWLSEHVLGTENDFVNVVAFARNGDLVASTSSMPSAQPLSATGRPYFEETILRGRGIVSAPFKSRLSGAQVVLVTAPVTGPDGAVAFVLAGRIDLQHANFLRQVDTLKPGRDGYLFLMSADGLLIDHPSSERLLQPVGALPGAYPGAARALRGVDGWVVGSDRGGQAIFSYKRLPGTGWVLGSRYPLDEALAPLAGLRREVLALAAALGLLGAGLAWWTVRRQLRPLDRLRRAAAVMRADGHGPGAGGATAGAVAAALGHAAVARADGAGVAPGRSAMAPPDGDAAALAQRGDEIGELADALFSLQAQRARTVARLRVAAGHLPAMLAYVDRAHRYVFVNGAFEQALGIAPGTALGRTVRETLGPVAYARLEPLIEAALRGQAGHTEDAREGDSPRQAIDCVPDIGPGGAVEGFFVLATDIGARRQAEEALAGSERRLRLIADHLPALVCRVDRNHRLDFGNAAFRTWLGLDPAALGGMHLADAIGRPAYDSARVRLKQAFEGQVVRFDMALQAQGRHRILAWTLVPDAQPDAGPGAVDGVVALGYDVTMAREAESELVRMARLDALTGVANRRLFGATLAQALSRGGHRRGGGRRPGPALAIVDLDRFGAINEAWGQDAGDEVLRETARRLDAAVDGAGSIARLGADRFAVLFDDDAGGEAGAAGRGAALAQALGAPFMVAGEALEITAGIAVVLAGGGEAMPGADRLLSAAESALREAKSGGPGRCVVRVCAGAGAAGAAQAPAGAAERAGGR